MIIFYKTLINSKISSILFMGIFICGKNIFQKGIINLKNKTEASLKNEKVWHMMYRELQIDCVYFIFKFCGSYTVFVS